ncbi:fibronectin type III domain-containing protein 7 [Genypterus blacodes]|uniref:fibronectin type III domain-containing protein 7 n=1 Tax=Genypterus blacodes TaxID=154954 RepID=UPI003F775C9A
MWLHSPLSVFTVTSKSMTVQWGRHAGASSYKITATPKNSPEPSVFAQFSGSTVMASVNSLSPNTVYTMQLEAMDNALHVISNEATEGKTAPDVPSIEKAYSKQSHSITVEFTEVSGATGYILRAETLNNDFFLEMPVSGSPGTIQELHSYTDFSLSVMSVNSGGRSQPSYPIQAKTVVVAANMTTSSPTNSTINATWTPVENAVLYTLDIIKHGSSLRQKLNTSATTITIESLEAGTTYSIKITPWDAEGRPGDDYTGLQITRPPRPDVLTVQIAPGRSLGIIVYWIFSYGAEGYVAWTTNNLNCTSHTTYCFITPVECGQNQTVSVRAFNSAGPSDTSEPAQYITYPCPRENWVVEPTPGNCTLKWEEVEMVEYYVAFIKRDEGTEEWCNTTETSCQFQCLCGNTYLTTVFPYNQAGASSQAPIRNYTTIPCCPEKVSIDLVSTETLHISWPAVRGVDVYETTAAENADIIHCNDTASECALSDLKCNTVYSVVVTPCSDLRGCNRSCAAHTSETAPCTPKILMLNQINNSTVTVVFTNPNTPVTNYTAKAVGRNDVHNCETQLTSCDFTQLPCGSTYEVTVVANNVVKESLPSFSMPLETAPCCPTSVKVLQVNEAMSLVSWSPAHGARSFIANLTSPRGQAKCHTMDDNCIMGCITCGTNYSVSLEAISSTGHLSTCNYDGYSTSPCCPTGIKLSEIGNSTVRVSWHHLGAFDQIYKVDMYSSSGNYTCTATGKNYCDMTSIVCGRSYKLVVSPMPPNKVTVEFCPHRLYSVKCTGNIGGMLIIRGKRSVA